jgi:hypothetical protein
VSEVNECSALSVNSKFINVQSTLRKTLVGLKVDRKKQVFERQGEVGV